MHSSLRPTDFSDAISDNNEGNPLGNYTYSFSTGGEIDTMEVSGYVYEAENLEPIKGIMVGLYDNLEDSVFRKEPFQRVSRTDSRGSVILRRSGVDDPLPRFMDIVNRHAEMEESDVLIPVRVLFGRTVKEFDELSAARIDINDPGLTVLGSCNVECLLEAE